MDDLGEFTCEGRFCPTGSTGESFGGEVNEIFTAVFGLFTIVAGLAFLIYFIIGAITWLTAGGDAQKVEKAQKTMTNGLIGLIIVVAAYGITWVLGRVLGFNILNPREALSSFIN